MQSRLPMIAFFGMLGLAIPAAGQVLQPLGLASGEPYRLAFVTSQRHDALSSDIETYNEFVQSVADSAPVVGEWGLSWTAIGSTETVDARDNTGTNLANGNGVPIYRVDGQLLAPDYRWLWDTGNDTENFEISVFFNVTELGTTLGSTPGKDGLIVYTGSNEAGTAFFRIGDNEPAHLGAPRSVFVGWGNDDNLSWFGAGVEQPPEAYHFYALSEVITVPEPMSASPLAIILVSVVAFQGRRLRPGTRR